MKNLKLRAVLGAVAFVFVLSLSATINPAKATALSEDESVILQQVFSPVEPEKVSSCMALLMDAANQAGLTGELETSEDTYNSEGNHTCSAQYLANEGTNAVTETILSLTETNKTPKASCKYDPLPEWENLTIEGYNARRLYANRGTIIIDENAYTTEEISLQWCMHAGGRNYLFFVFTWSHSTELTGPVRDPIPIAKTMINIAETRLPLTDELYEITEPPMDDTITETNEPTEEPEIMVVPYGGETEEPQVEVVPYGESGTEETTPEEGSFAETWDSEQARAIRSPYLPIVGGLIGGGAAWLFAQGAAKASGYVSSMAAAAPAPVVVPEVPQTPPELVTEPPELVSEPPPIQAEPPAAPEAPKTPLELGFNLVKDSLSGGATTLDKVKDNFSLADSPETMDAIRKAMKAWKSAPSAETLADYLKSLRLTNALKMEDLSDKLGKAGKALDLVEAGMKAQKICAARGYKGLDAVLTTYAEVGKKALVWGITKNPAVGAIDTVAGSVTTILYGSDNKIDVGAVVEKAADAWDKVTQEAGELYNSDIVEAGKQYEYEGKLNLVNRIKESVKSGSVSKEEGARRLRAVLDKFNQETPKL